MRSHRPNVSEGTAALIRGMTARKREDRYPTAEALVLDLDRLLAGEAPRGPGSEGDRARVEAEPTAPPPSDPVVVPTGRALATTIPPTPPRFDGKPPHLELLAGALLLAAGIWLVVIVASPNSSSSDAGATPDPIGTIVASPSPTPSPAVEPDSGAPHTGTGTKPQQDAPAAPTSPTTDAAPSPVEAQPRLPAPPVVEAEPPPVAENVSVVEAHEVLIQRAFPAGTELIPTRGFERLKLDVSASGKRELLFVIEIRSKIVFGGAHPNVYATGLWVRVKNRATRTVSPVIKVEFEGGPYQRPVTIDSQGHRALSPFDKAVGLDATKYIRQVEDIVRERLRRR